jgi:hypothetical protein
MTALIHTRSYYAYRSVRLHIRTFVGQFALAYGILQKALRTPRSLQLVVPDTQLCIEAPSGSGNSFFVNGFALANPCVRVAHHHHVAAQIKRAVMFNVPTIVILRNPVDCVVSRSCREPGRITAVYWQWIRFFRAVSKLRDRILLASFRSATKCPGDVLRTLNSTFETKFNANFPKSDDIFRRMDERFMGPTRIRRTQTINPNRPSPEKEALKKKIRPIVAQHHLSSMALKIYESLVQDAI